MTVPLVLADWLVAETAAGRSVAYSAFNEKARSKALREALLQEQLGLCAYTGRAVAEYETTVEHIKPQSLCKEELNSGAKSPPGDDVLYANMAATHKTYEAPHYGESVRGNWYDSDYVSPRDPSCGMHFDFFTDGTVQGKDSQGKAMIKNLRLDDQKLKEERVAAIDVVTSEYLEAGDIDIAAFVQIVLQVVDGNLPSYSFVIESALPKYES